MTETLPLHFCRGSRHHEDLLAQLRPGEGCGGGCGGSGDGGGCGGGGDGGGDILYMAAAAAAAVAVAVAVGMAAAMAAAGDLRLWPACDRRHEEAFSMVHLSS